MNKKTGLLFVLFTALVSGFSIFVNKFGVSGMDSSIFTGIKNIVVAIFLFSAILILNEFKVLLSLKKSDWGKLVLIGFFGGSIPFLLFFKGLTMTSGAAAAFIHKTMFIFVAILAIVFLKEKLNKNILIAAVLLLAGNALLLKFQWMALNTGTLMILAATLLWAVETVISKNALKDLSGKTVAFGRMFFGSLFIILFWIITGKTKLLLTTTLPQLSWVLLTSAFLFLYVFSWYSGLKHIKASVAACVLLLGAPITTLLNYFFLDAALTLSQSAGIFLIVTGIAAAIGFARILKLFTPASQLQAKSE